MSVGVQLQVSHAAARGQRRKAVIQCWSAKRDELEHTNQVQWTEALYRFSAHDAFTVVGPVLEKYFEGDFPHTKRKITFEHWPPGYQLCFIDTQRVKRGKKEEKCELFITVCP